MAVQQGRRRVETGGVPSVGYVEDFDELRTQLADFFSILLARELADSIPPQIRDWQIPQLFPNCPPERFQGLSKVWSRPSDQFDC
jgi:hypothetical protein